MNDLNYDNVRLWQCHFSVLRPLETLPVPEMIVEEKQNDPSYCWDGKRRFEDGAQLVLTLAGEGSIRIREKEFCLSAGKCFIHNHNDPGVCYFYPPGGKEPWHFLWFAFFGGSTRALVEEINRDRGYIFDIDLASPVVKELREFRNYAGVVQIISPFEGSSLVLDTIGKICFPQEIHPSSYSAVTIELQNMIAADPSADLQVEKLAQSFQISREHLSRIFCRETGVSLHEYIIRFRLKIAMDLLRRSRLSLKEVALRSGWHDYSNFYRLFIKRFKCSPQKIRDGEKTAE